MFCSAKARQHFMPMYPPLSLFYQTIHCHQYLPPPTINFTPIPSYETVSLSTPPPGIKYQRVVVISFFCPAFILLLPSPSSWRTVIASSLPLPLLTLYVYAILLSKNRLIRCPTYLLLMSRISATDTSIFLYPYCRSNCLHESLLPCSPITVLVNGCLQC